VKIVDLSSFYDRMLEPDGLLVITDLSLIGGVAEDIRRKERLLIAWRRIAARASLSNTRVIAQGPEELLTDAVEWLTAQGVERTWNMERADRSAFGYPPATRLVKLIVSGTESVATSLMQDLEPLLKTGMSFRGPYPVAYRSASRGERQVVLLAALQAEPESNLISILDRFKKRAIIDLDPVAFFS
jgi:primosomal protein N'